MGNFLCTYRALESVSSAYLWRGTNFIYWGGQSSETTRQVHSWQGLSHSSNLICQAVNLSETQQLAHRLSTSHSEELPILSAEKMFNSAFLPSPQPLISSSSCLLDSWFQRKIVSEGNKASDVIYWPCISGQLFKLWSSVSLSIKWEKWPHHQVMKSK